MFSTKSWSFVRKQILKELQPLFFLPFESLKNSGHARGKKLPAIFLPIPPPQLHVRCAGGAMPSSSTLTPGAKDTRGQDELFARSSLTKRARTTADGVREKKGKKKTGFERQRDHACSSIIGLCLSLSHHEIICRGGGRSLRARLLNRVSVGHAETLPRRAADLII